MGKKTKPFIILKLSFNVMEWLSLKKIKKVWQISYHGNQSNIYV